MNSTLYDDVKADSTEFKAMKHMTTLWTNFAKYG